MNGKEKTLVCKVGSLIRVFAIMLSQSVNNRWKIEMFKLVSPACFPPQQLPSHSRPYFLSYLLPATRCFQKNAPAGLLNLFSGKVPGLTPAVACPSTRFGVKSLSFHLPPLKVITTLRKSCSDSIQATTAETSFASDPFTPWKKALFPSCRPTDWLPWWHSHHLHRSSSALSWRLSQTGDSTIAGTHPQGGITPPPFPSSYHI